MVRCELCGLEFRKITWKHLHFYHGKTLDAYRREFPGSKICDEEAEELRCRATSLGMKNYRARLSKEEVQALGTKTSKGLEAYWARLDAETYEKFRRQRSEQVSTFHSRMLPEDYQEWCKVNSKSKQIYWNNLSEEGRRKRGRAVSKALEGMDLGGENSPSWRGGHVSSYGYGWVATRELIYMRDDDTCQKCGRTEFTKNNPLCCHHINHDVEDIDESNLIALCSTCNKSINGNDRGYWMDFFHKILTEKFGYNYKEDYKRC